MSCQSNFEDSDLHLYKCINEKLNEHRDLYKEEKNIDFKLIMNDFENSLLENELLKGNTKKSYINLITEINSNQIKRKKLIHECELFSGKLHSLKISSNDFIINTSILKSCPNELYTLEKYDFIENQILIYNHFESGKLYNLKDFNNYLNSLTNKEFEFYKPIIEYLIYWIILHQENIDSV